MKKELKNTGLLSTDYASGFRRTTPKLSKDEVSRKIAQLRERDEELVTGIFKFNEMAGGTLDFGFHKWPGDKFEIYSLTDGEKYTIPRMVAHHLNNNCYYREYKHLSGETGDTGIRAAYNDGKMKGERMQAHRKIHRTSFTSLDFMDDDIDMKQSDLVEVTVSP